MHLFNQSLKYGKSEIYLYFRDKDGNTFLHLLCLKPERESLYIVEKFLNKLRFDLNVRNKLGYTPLMLAVINDNP